MMYHTSNPSRTIPRPLRTANLKEIVGVWDASYVDVDLELVFKVLLVCEAFNGDGDGDGDYDGDDDDIVL